MDYFIIMIYLFFYWIKLQNAIIWFLFELYSKKIFFTQWVKTKFPFPLNVLSPIPSTKIPVPVDQIPFSHPLHLKAYLFHQRTGSSNGKVKTFDVTVRKIYTWHGG